jgi:rod shape determining protein RodA
MKPQVWSIKGQRPLIGWRSVISLRMPWWRIDWPVLLLGLGLFALGLVLVGRMAEADLLYGRSDIEPGEQLKKALIAAPALVLGLLLRPRWVRRNAYALYGLAMVLLVLVPVFGMERNGARRWIEVPIIGFDLQPSELAKIGVILALARTLHRSRLDHLADWRLPVALVLLPMALVAAQPDLGTALTLVPVALGIFWMAGARTRILAGAVLTAALVGYTAWNLDWLHGYQAKRIDTWVRCLDNEALIANRKGAAFHPYMARMFIGHGGWLGTGLGQGVANQSGNLPERECDSIFAVIAEEGGFVGASALVFFYLAFAALLIVAAGRTRERFSRLVIAGAGLYFASHFAINTGVNLGLVPMTGLTLPLISAGGSSLLASLALLGLALGLSARAEPTLDSDSFRE